MIPPRTIDQRGRPKAYRPMAEQDRRAALEAGLEAYERGDFFLAHELLEPAWMGTQDVAERELLQGLIKLAAAYVHAVRGNPRGTVKSLRGSLVRVAAGRAAGVALGVDADALAAAIGSRLARLEDRAAADAGGSDSGPPRGGAVEGIAIPRIARGRR